VVNVGGTTPDQDAAAAALIRGALSGHIRNWGGEMDGKARIVFPIVITAIIVFVVSGVVTFVNIGLRPGFVAQWLRAFAIGWPVATIVAFIAIPHARRLTQWIVARIEGAA